jgi:hypothetical protein
VWVSSRASYARTIVARPELGRPRAGPFPKNCPKFGVFTIFRGSSAHTGRATAVVVAGAVGRWVGVMEGPTGVLLSVFIRRFLALKNPKFRPFGSRNGSEMAEERLEKRPGFGQGHGHRLSWR